MLKKTIQVLQSFQAVKGAAVQQRSSIIIEKRPGVKEISKEQKNGYVQGLLPSSVTEEELKQIMQKLKEEKIDADLQIALPTGQLFPDYGELDNVLDDNKTKLTHTPGEVLLIDLWATWCPPCQEPMSHNQEMLQKNKQKWQDKVRIIGVSVDQQKECIKKRIIDRKWDKIQHLTLLGWKEGHRLIKDFKIQSIPFICLVDKFGKINYAGHPNQIDLENKINQLLNASQEQTEAAKSPSDLSQKNQSSLQSPTQDQVLKAFEDVDLFCFKYDIRSTYQRGIFSTIGRIHAFINDDVQGGVQKVREFFLKVSGVQIKVDTVKYVDVPSVEGSKCWECGQEISYPCYWLRWEQGLRFGCRKCIQASNNIPKHHYKYERNAVLLAGKWPKVPLKGLGNNSQPGNVATFEQPHAFLCNVCSKPCYQEVGKARYICLGCRADPNFKGDYVDICEKCVQGVISGNVQKGLKQEGHLPQHPLLRILYQTHGYYDF